MGKPKNAKKEFLAILSIGLIVIIVAITCLLVFYRPFIIWKKLNFENNIDGVVEFTSGPNATYYYEIDGIEYCKTLKGVGGYSFQTDTGIYYILYINADDPSDVKRGSLGLPMLISTLGLIATGGLIIWFGFHQKKSIIKKQINHAKKRSGK